MSSTLTDWTSFYRPDFILRPESNKIAAAGSISDATVVTTTATGDPPKDGRVTKTGKKRSRASRRTPTTLLNTDTANFRAMVQQFTGGVGGPLPSDGGSGWLSFNFRMGGRQYGAVSSASSASYSGFSLQRSDLMEDRYHSQSCTAATTPYMVSMINSNGDGGFYDRLRVGIREEEGEVVVGDGYGSSVVQSGGDGFIF